MNRLQEFLDNPHIITGTATVAADPQLALIAANKAFYTLVGETAESFRQQGNALLPWIEQSSAVRLIGLLAGHPPLFDWEGALVRKDGTSVRIRLSGTRMEGVLHEGRYPVYLSAFTDLACVEEMLRSAEYERRKYALIVTRQTVLCTTPFSFGMRKLEKSILWHTVCINRKRGVCSRRSVYAASPRSG